MSDSKIIFLGKYRWRYRGKAILFALKAFYMALRGYEVAVTVEARDHAG